MRTMLNFAKNFHKHYPNHSKNMWAESLAKGDIILVDDKPVVYLSHTTRQTPNGMGGYRTCTEYQVVTSFVRNTFQVVNDISNSIKPIGDNHE